MTWMATTVIKMEVATGTAMGALSAALIDVSAQIAPGLAPVVSSTAPTFGLAAGGLGASALVQYGPAPMRLVYLVVLAGLVADLDADLVVEEPTDLQEHVQAVGRRLLGA